MNIDFFIIYYLHDYYGKYESQHLLQVYKFYFMTDTHMSHL